MTSRFKIPKYKIFVDNQKAYDRVKEEVFNHYTFDTFPHDIEVFNSQGRSALDPLTSRIRSFQFRKGEHAVFIDYKKFHNVDEIFQIVTDTGITKIIHNAKYEYTMYKGVEDIVIRNLHCTMLADQIIYNGLELKNSFEAVVHRRLGLDLDKTKQKSNWGRKTLTRKQIVYGLWDVIPLEEIYLQQMENIEEANLQQVYRIEMEHIPIVGDMELTGVLLDRDHYWELLDRKEKEKADVLQKIQKCLPKVPLAKSNLNTKAKRAMYPDGIRPPQTNSEFKKAYQILEDCTLIVREYARKPVPKKERDRVQKAINIVKKYGRLTGDLPTVWDRKKKENRFSLSASTYGKIPHRSGNLLETHEKVKKLITSYLRPMAGKTVDRAGVYEEHPVDHKTHPDIRQFGTVTQRYSKGHNRTPRDSDVRKGFIPSRKYYLGKHDFSQLELRIASVLYGSQSMQEIYRKAEYDIHTLTGSRIYHVKLKDVTKEQRQLGKNVNFGTIYDQTDWGLKNYLWKEAGLDFSVTDCKHFVDSFYSLFPEIKEHHRALRKDVTNALMSGEYYEVFGQDAVYFQTSVLGLVRWWKPDSIPIKTTYDKYTGEEILTAICNDVLNFKVQSTAGGGIKLAQNKLYRYWLSKKCLSRMIMQVHDELVTELWHETLREDEMAVRYFMENTVQKVIPEVPIIVEGGFGKNWSEIKEVSR